MYVVQVLKLRNCILSRHSTYTLHIILMTNSQNFLKQINWLVFVTESEFVFCKSRTELSKIVYINLMFVPCIIRRIRKDQKYALIVPLIYSMYWLLHVWAVAYHLQWACMILLRYLEYKSNGRISSISSVIQVFQVTQKDLRSSLMMAGYCRNM
jgi:hypothetical protein